jgi:phi13 family phage major tail protein
MAKIGIKGLTYAKVSAGGDGSALTYTGGKVLADYLAKADIGENRDNIKEHADDHQIDAENALNEVTLALELVNMNEDIKKDILGHEATGTTGELQVTGKDAPFVGIGFIVKNRFKGTSKFEGYWFHKVQFSSGGMTANTRKDQTQFDHETINGSVQGVILTSGGDVVFYKHFDEQTTEAAVRTWLNGCAGVSSGNGGSP